jgi:hypothetical protein
MGKSPGNRPLATEERKLARYMLEHGGAAASKFLGQLERAEVTPWHCQCGCASVNFQIEGFPLPDPGVHALGDFLCGPQDTPSGIFIFESGGILSGIEVYSLSGDAPRKLPAPDELRSCQQSGK